MQTVKRLATATWLVPLVFVFGKGIVGLVIGPVLADVLVFVLAVAGVITAVVCLLLIPKYGRQGILGPALAGLLVCLLLLAIWIPNFLAARERARARRNVADAHSALAREL
jgi:hypothetical protein